MCDARTGEIVERISETDARNRFVRMENLLFWEASNIP